MTGCWLSMMLIKNLKRRGNNYTSVYSFSLPALCEIFRAVCDLPAIQESFAQSQQRKRVNGEKKKFLKTFRQLPAFYQYNPV